MKTPMIFEPLLPEHLLIARRSFLQIFQQATVDFFRHGSAFLVTLLLPIGLIYGGTYIGLLSALSSYEVDKTGIFILIIFICMSALFVGFWQFLVFFASFNRSYANVLSGKLPQCWYEYQQLLKAHQSKLAWYINGLLLIQVVAGTAIWILTLPLMFFLPENIVGLVIQLLVFIPYTFVSMGFQILAFGQPDSGCLGVLKQSINFIKTRFWSCFLVLIVCFVLTYYIIPGIVVMVAEISGGVSWFSQFHHEALYQYLLYISNMRGQLPPEAQPLLAQMPFFHQDLHQVSADLSHQLSQSLLTSVVNSLLLPWGTFVYALVYGDIKARQSENDTGS